MSPPELPGCTCLQFHYSALSRAFPSVSHKFLCLDVYGSTVGRYIFSDNCPGIFVCVTYCFPDSNGITDATSLCLKVQYLSACQPGSHDMLTSCRPIISEIFVGQLWKICLDNPEAPAGGLAGAVSDCATRTISRNEIRHLGETSTQLVVLRATPVYPGPDLLSDHKIMTNK